jgi:hypothetical protein
VNVGGTARIGELIDVHSPAGKYRHDPRPVMARPTSTAGTITDAKPPTEWITEPT